MEFLTRPTVQWQPLTVATDLWLKRNLIPASAPTPNKIFRKKVEAPCYAPQKIELTSPVLVLPFPIPGTSSSVEKGRADAEA
jgi:hypothetical protein